MNASRKALPPRIVHDTRAFRKDLQKAAAHRKCDLGELTKVMLDLEQRRPLDPKYLDHKLKGKYPQARNGDTDCRECHTSNDWLLIYRLPDDDTVVFIRTGTHSELFVS